MNTPLSSTLPGSRYVVGIDLGTTNSAVAYVDMDRKKRIDRRSIRFFEVPQLVAPGELAARPTLPSFLYLPGSYDLPEGSTALPWDPGRGYAVGELARDQGTRVPSRLVASAKSWLTHAGVDRTAHILPWGIQGEVSKVSPVEASTRYLQHIREAWNVQMAEGRTDEFLENQLVILTVPASFDEVARELTVTAAQRAGLPNVILLEEPLAACYAWLHDHEATWQAQMQDGQLILVCDVGGGTSDFSIVGLRADENGLHFTRLAVGDHLMLGGDNMDLTLGRFIETKLVGEPGKLDPKRWRQVVYQCRQAKEQLLDEPPERTEVEIAVAGSGSQLIAETLSAVLARPDVERLIVEGFFPEVALDETFAGLRRTGLTELGLPYVQDPAVTRHLAAFWRHAMPVLQQETGREAPYPEYILFNGGALAPAFIRHRLTSIVRAWFEPVAGSGWQPTELSNPRLDLAVSMGAAYYGRVRRGEGVRIRSGSPRAYYVGVETGDGTSPTDGQDAEGMTAVCLVPRGMEEGFEVRLDQPNFEALTNQPVAFHLFASSTRSGDELGDVVHVEPEEVSLLPPIRTVLQYGKKGVANRLPVQLAVRLTEIGTLELWCQSVQTPHRWQLHFDVRQEPEAETPESLDERIDPDRLTAARRVLRNTFAPDSADEALPPAGLRKLLEAALDLPRAEWPLPLIRKLGDTLLDLPRGDTPQHEARWISFLGYFLRPGYGDLVDEWRMSQVWKLYFEGLHHPESTQGRIEWWIFWRRVAGGLGASKQAEIYRDAERTQQAARGKRTSPSTQETMEYWRALANFERLNPNVKSDLGRTLLRRFKRARPNSEELWILSRLGARIPMYASIDTLVPGSEAAAWLKILFGLNLPKSVHVARALVNLAQHTGDRLRDVSDKTRTKVDRWLAQVPDGDAFRDALHHPDRAAHLDEQNWVFGESLPTGLVLSND